MPRPRRGWVERAPRPHGKRWRFRVSIDGQTRYRSFASKSQAERAIRAYQAEILGSERSTASAIDEYRERLKLRRIKPESVAAIVGRITRFFPPSELDTPVQTWRESQIKGLYLEHAKTRAAATHRVTLQIVRGFFRHAKEEGWIHSDPSERVRGIGKINRGKPQLSTMEARRLLKWCIKQPIDDRGVLGTMIALMLGMRASEICGLTIRSWDGRILRIEKAKTNAGKRALCVPEAFSLRQRISICFQQDDVLMRGRDRQWLYYQVRKNCKLAGVPAVCTHGLRGTWATLGQEASGLPDAVARGLGHAGSQITEKHYIADGAVERVQGERALTLLRGGK